MKDSLDQDNYPAMCPHIQKQPFSTQVHHPQCAWKDQDQLSLSNLAATGIRKQNIGPIRSNTAEKNNKETNEKKKERKWSTELLQVTKTWMSSYTVSSVIGVHRTAK